MSFSHREEDSGKEQHWSHVWAKYDPSLTAVSWATLPKLVDDLKIELNEVELEEIAFQMNKWQSSQMLIQGFSRWISGDAGFSRQHKELRAKDSALQDAHKKIEDMGQEIMCLKAKLFSIQSKQWQNFGSTLRLRSKLADFQALATEYRHTQNKTSLHLNAGGVLASMDFDDDDDNSLDEFDTSSQDSVSQEPRQVRAYAIDEDEPIEDFDNEVGIAVIPTKDGQPMDYYDSSDDENDDEADQPNLSQKVIVTDNPIKSNKIAFELSQRPSRSALKQPSSNATPKAKDQRAVSFRRNVSFQDTSPSLALLGKICSDRPNACLL